MTVRCSRCRAFHDDASWTALPLVQHLGARDTSGVMTSWPWNGAAAIEARRCPCGYTQALLRISPTPPAPGTM